MCQHLQDYPIVSKNRITCLHEITLDRGSASDEVFICAGGLWHAEVEMRVHSRGKLEGQYFTTRGTYGELA